MSRFCKYTARGAVSEKGGYDMNWRGAASRVACTAGIVGVAMLMYGSQALATSVLANCSKSIDIEGTKLDKKVLGALKVCKIKYRAAIDNINKGKDRTTELTKAAVGCQTQLDKNINLSNPASAAAKAKAKLDSLVPGGKCDDTSLLALGHFPEATFADTWSRWVVLAKIKWAIVQQVWLVRDSINAFQEMADIDGDGNNDGNCSLCDKITKPACATHACILDAGSGAVVHTASVTIPVTLVGAVMVEICRDPAIIGNNDFFVIGEITNGFQPVNLGIGNACVKAIGAEGYITATGSSRPQVNYTICQDHTGNGTETDDCPTAVPGCATQGNELPDRFHTGVINGAPCVKLTTSPSNPGDSMVLNTTQITVVFNLQEGPDGLPCTSDDVALPGIPSTIPLTTGSGTARVEDRDQNPGDVLGPFTASGSPFGNASATEQSNLSGATLAGAFPGIDGLDLPPRVDTVTEFTLVCQ